MIKYFIEGYDNFDKSIGYFLKFNKDEDIIYFSKTLEEAKSFYSKSLALSIKDKCVKILNRNYINSYMLHKTTNLNLRLIYKKII